MLFLSANISNLILGFFQIFSFIGCFARRITLENPVTLKDKRIYLRTVSSEINRVIAHEVTNTDSELCKNLGLTAYDGRVDQAAVHS